MDWEVNGLGGNRTGRLLDSDGSGMEVSGLEVTGREVTGMEVSGRSHAAKLSLNIFHMGRVALRRGAPRKKYRY